MRCRELRATIALQGPKGASRVRGAFNSEAGEREGFPRGEEEKEDGAFARKG